MTTAVTTVDATTLGECWLRTSAAILEHGSDATYDGLAIKELAHMALSVASPIPRTSSSRVSATRPGRAGCTRTSSAPRRSRARERAQLRGAPVRLRGQRSRPARVGRRTAPRRPGVAVGDDHDLRAAGRHDATSRASACSTSGRRPAPRARRLRPQPRLRQEGLREPRRARAPAGAASPVSSGSPSARSRSTSSRPTSTSPSGS